MIEIKQDKDGVRIPVYVAPRASRTQITGFHEGAVKIRLAAPPVDGAANDELTQFLAKFFGAPKTSVSIVGGQTSKRKIVLIAGLSADEAVEKLKFIDK